MVSLTSRMEALESRNSTLKKKLIDSMDEANTLKEKVKTLSDEQLLGAKEKLKTIAARFVKAFQ